MLAFSRKICDGCKTAYVPAKEELDFAALHGFPVPDKLYRGQGCSRCSMTGYYDRVGVFEVLTMTTLRLCIAENMSSRFTGLANMRSKAGTSRRNSACSFLVQ